MLELYDPYCSPEKFGLEAVGDIDFSDGCYQFDMTAVWREKSTGDLMWADDWGCSCPSPFDHMGLDDLTRGTFHQLAHHLNERANDSSEPNVRVEVVELLSRLS